MKFVKNSEIFSKIFEKKSKFFGLDKAPTAEKVAQKCNKNENFGG